MDNIKLDHLGILVTTSCNLNCRDCADLIPKRKNKIYLLDDIKSDLLNVLSVVDFIDEVLLIGGEILLYPHLRDLIIFCASQNKIGKIIITTNGTIDPTESIVKTIKDYRVIVRVSGYPENVAPDRENIINRLISEGIEVEDFKGMIWLSMGSYKKRNLTDDQLEEVFRTCSMKECISMNRDGKIYYCSRQMSADELPIYPNPLDYEIINVRDKDNLLESIKKFYSLRFISTCDYCDGISCKTKKRVPTAVQILNKSIFLDLIQLYYELQCSISEQVDIGDKFQIVRKVTSLIMEHMDRLEGIKEVHYLFGEIQAWKKTGDCDFVLFGQKLCILINRLSQDYKFEWTNSENLKSEKIQNMVVISKIIGDKADLILSKADFEEQANKKYPMSGVYYNRLFVESKFEKIKTTNVECVVCGLSYTQYGIIEKKMSVSAANISITGEDIPYSLLMAKRAIGLSDKIRYVVVPISYYQGFYDMSIDMAKIHRDVMELINIPILSDNRHYSDYQCNENYLQFFDEISDLSLYVEDRDEICRSRLQDEDFFNDYTKAPKTGELSFDFHDLSEEDKYISAKITADLNERVCSDFGKNEVISSIKSFLLDIPENIQVMFFVPPMTKYLYHEYSNQLKDAFNNEIRPLFLEYNNVHFFDWSSHNSFTDEDFSDFEHLNYNGAEKLTDIISAELKGFSVS